MKVTVGYMAWKEKELEVPDKFCFKFEKEEDDWTDEEWELSEDEFWEWLDEAIGEPHNADEYDFMT
jgi:hypothetical protein